MKDYYNVEDIKKITGASKSWCYETIRKLRKDFSTKFKDAICPQAKIPIWYFEERMQNKPNKKENPTTK